MRHAPARVRNEQGLDFYKSLRARARHSENCIYAQNEKKERIIVI